MQEKQLELSIEDSQWSYNVGAGIKNEVSSHYDKYKQFFEQLGCDRFDYDPLSSSSFPRQLNKHKIKFSRKKFSPFTVNIVSNSSNHEIADIELQWGYYSLRATIIKNAGESIFHKCGSSNGSLAKVYMVEDQQEPFAVKCVSTKFQKYEDKIKLQKCALQEYFIFRIASALGCGPLMKKSFGFDLLFSQDCIQFAMEYCSELKSMSQKVASRLKQSLLTLHQARIIHFDIKPDNVMWSSHFKKEVFIDFGLSQILDGGPGLKYPVSFKGSLNYCSEEMGSLFSSQGKKQLDVYYNDTNCLKETILAFQNSFVLSEQEVSSLPQQQQLIIEYYDQELMCPNQISENQIINLNSRLKKILLKYFIYIKNSENIDEIYKTAQKDFLFSGEIMSFTKDIYSTDHFREFYKRYITNSIIDSVQYGWIGVWAKSIYSKMAEIQAQNPQQTKFFISLSQSLQSLSSRTSKKNIGNLNRAELQTILLSKDIGDVQLYFYCCVKYISFINNYHQVDAQQKMTVAEAFIQKLLPQFAKDKQKRILNSFVKNLIELLNEICRYILCYYARGQFESSETILAHTDRLQLILDIIEHVFFFSLFSTDEAIDLLSKIYFLNIWSQQQRMEIIIRLSNDNGWNIVPLFTEESISFIEIQNWIYLRIVDFRKQKFTPEVQVIWGMYELRSGRSDSYLKDYQPFNYFSTSFKIHFWLQTLLRQLFFNKKYVLVKIMKFIEDNFPQNQRRRLYFLYFHIFSEFANNYINRQESWSICQLFKSHLRCDELFNRLVFLRILKMQKDNSVKGKIKQLATIVKLIKYENIGFLMTLLLNQLKIIFPSTDKVSEMQVLNQPEVLNLVQSMKQALYRINFKTKFQSLFTRKCENQKHLYFYFILQLSIHFLIRQPYRALSDDINQLQTIIQNEKCQLCKCNMRFQFIQIKIQESIYFQPQTAAQNLIQICRVYENFQKMLGNRQISRQVCFVDRVLKTYNSITLKFIHLKCTDQKLLQILYKIYIFCKTANIIERFFQGRCIPNVMLYSIKAVSQFGGFEQLTHLLRDVFHYIRYTENTLKINVFCHDFLIFLENYLMRTKPQLLMNIMKFLKNQEKRQPYVASFYYAYILSTKDNSCRYTYIIRIFKLIQFMPLRICSFFQSSLYCFILYKDDTFLQMFISKTAQQQLFPISIFKSRKVKQIERMLIKLVHNILNAPYNRKESSKKLVRAKQTLLQKCRNIGSYMIPEYADKTLYLKPVFF